MKIPSLILALLLAAAVASCSRSGEEKAAIQNKIVLVLFDLSESTNKPEIRRAYAENFLVILSRIAHGDALVAGWITERSGAELVLPVNRSFPAFAPGTDNPLLIQAWKGKADSALGVETQKIHHLIDSLLQNPSRRVLNTDILSSLDIANRVFRNFAQARKILVIMSDMIEDSPSYNFERENLTPERINRIIDTAKSEDRIPNLQAVRVYVAGASAADIRRLNQIRDFWSTFFQKTGAVLVDYGGALVAFNE